VLEARQLSEVDRESRLEEHVSAPASRVVVQAPCDVAVWPTFRAKRRLGVMLQACRLAEYADRADYKLGGHLRTAIHALVGWSVVKRQRRDMPAVGSTDGLTICIRR
jgi:ABC-type arginine transport system ATPase subunit